MMKTENERLRGLLRDAKLKLSPHFHGPMIAKIDAALSQQAEPTYTYTAVDMATAAAQGFRDGQAAVEPAPAQDEREAFDAWYATEEAFAAGDSNGWYGIARAAWMARAGRPAQAVPQHSDDEAVDRFAVAMKAKLAASREKGRHGWQSATAPHLSALLYDHMYKADPLDVGNLAMMLHQNGQAIELPQEARGRRRTAPQPEQSGLVEAAGAVIRAADWWSANEDSPKSALAHFARATDALRAALSAQPET